MKGVIILGKQRELEGGGRVTQSGPAG